MKKMKKFEWITEQQNAFKTFLKKLMIVPALKYSDFIEKFIVITNVYPIGTILSQEKVDNDRPIAYASRVLLRTE